MPADPAPNPPPSGLQPVPVRYEFSANLPELIDQLELAMVLTTYQAGRLVTVGSAGGELQVGFSHFPQAMGLARTPTGLAVASRDAVWRLPANREIAASIEPEAGHDIAFLARSCHRTGPVLAHELAWCGGELLLVNTLFNCVVGLEEPWSFTPRWRPAFISAIAPGDRCHLNGVAVGADGQRLAYATAHGSGDSDNSWREGKASGGCLIDAASGAVVLRGLAMPHSPRLHRGKVYLLDSGEGRLLAVDPARLNAAAAQEAAAVAEVIAELPGFCRGLDVWGPYALVGLSQIRETAVFGGLPLQERHEQLRCGVALVHLEERRLAGWLWFNSGVEEIFAASFLPGWRHPVVVGPEPDIDQRQTIWLVPPAD
ncbi:MAG: TIGR03032 family protein [Cyanobacteriota bacterium]|nr:TIGR03032 family protein [Cyanobacteriota bacterium]